MTPALGRWTDALSRPAAGIGEWSLHVTTTARVALGIKDTETGNAHAPLLLGHAAGARYLFVWRDGRVSRGALEHRQLAGDPHETLPWARAAAYDDPAAAAVLGPAPMPDVVLYDPRAARAATGDTELLATRLDVLRRRVAAARLRTYSGSFSAARVVSHIVTSQGLDAESAGTSIGWWITLDGEIGSGFGARAPEADEEFAARLDRLVEWLARLGRPGRGPSSGTAPVILHPRVVEDYVFGTLLHHLDGATVDHDEGLFSRADFAARRAVVREDLHLRLDPLRALGAGSYRFSVEGLPAARCSFLERGRLVQPVLDLKYARRLDLAPTPQPYALDALELGGPAPLALAEACAAGRGGILVLSVLGTHTQDSTSGEFSLSAAQSVDLAHGAPGGRVRATISGNLFELLRDEALALVGFPGERTPGLLVRCRVDTR